MAAIAMGLGIKTIKKEKKNLKKSKFSEELQEKAGFIEEKCEMIEKLRTCCVKLKIHDRKTRKLIEKVEKKRLKSK